MFFSKDGLFYAIVQESGQSQWSVVRGPLQKCIEHRDLAGSGQRVEDRGY